MESAQALRTLQKKRTSNFREDETKLLIELWGSPQIQNKLYLTHRKAPVMRLLAANMQQRGFYRTPDEIKTRIRNLKCLYHRIKRTMQSGAGIGTVDPDWPHFKAMDDILSKQNQKKETLYKDNIFEGPRCEDIKQEIDDIDINDDMESYTTNSMADSDYEDETTKMPTLTPAPQKEPKKEPSEVRNAPTAIKPKPTIMPNVTIPTSNANIGIRQGGTTSSLPFPLLILNGMPTNNLQTPSEKLENNNGFQNTFGQIKTTTVTPDITGILKSLLDVQKEALDVQKQRLELDKQKLDFERLVGSQLLTLLPMLGGLLQRVAFTNNAENSSSNSAGGTKNGRKRSCPESGLDILKDSKILRNVLEQGIKTYMMGEQEEEDSENEDSGIQNDDNSNSSK